MNWANVMNTDDWSMTDLYIIAMRNFQLFVFSFHIEPLIAICIFN